MTLEIKNVRVNLDNGGEGGSDDTHTIPFVSLNDPELRRDFRAVAASTKEVKDGRANLLHICNECGKTSDSGDKLLKCSRNSSEERDRLPNSRPAHKVVCQHSESAEARLIPSFLANTVLNDYLQIILVFVFKLLEEPNPENPLIAECDVELFPADTARQLQLLFSGEKEPETEGMLQVRGMKSLDSETSIDDVRMALWKSKKEWYRKQGHPDVHVVLVDFVMRRTKQRSTFAVGLLETAFDRIRSGSTLEMKSSMFGSTFMPLSIAACLDAINTHIRSDKRNQLRLRATLLNWEPHSGTE
ncbi:hypothetical protein JR316_0005454 [Psilocybe cubensis]|uniref:DUF8205 domain-containing protein n=2 Tax=Psilocybe cubensis TaxID=181762 RepID=A0A8H7XMT2_PSICU|nr:hypothetical protein JR316_0005454 [Psilocybe cubensis]KAH9483348.1 hypothetical protein JR316_0005454 [Psilocybe cubensis]